MPTIEITRAGDASVTDQTIEMREWLRETGIHPLELEPVRILRGQVRFRASFASTDDAERFRGRFDEKGAGDPA